MLKFFEKEQFIGLKKDNFPVGRLLCLLTIFFSCLPLALGYTYSWHRDSAGFYLSRLPWLLSLLVAIFLYRRKLLAVVFLLFSV